MTEFVLSGGRTTAGVVRIGDSVRRPAGPNAEFVRLLLRHLKTAGFEGAPRYLGCDDANREMLSYISGRVPVELSDYHDGVLHDAARLIRSYHDATLAPGDLQFDQIRGPGIVCHNDLSPCNAVFRDGRPVALIDFDAAAPGSRASDLGYAAWLWLDIGNTERSGPEQKRRLHLFLGAYGTTLTATEILQSMLARQSQLMADGARTGHEAMHDWAEKCRSWTVRYLLDICS
jgi:hypothetical protein